MVSTGKMLAFINALGGSSGPSEVVILPETELMHEDGTFFLTAPFAADLEDGKTYAVTFYGETYDCKAVYFEEDSMSAFMLGNIPAESGLTGGNPDAPFLMLYSHAGGILGQAGVYCFIQLMAELESWDGVSPVTLSIVQTEGAASGGESAGGGIFEVNVPVTKYNTSSGHDFGEFDKTFAELVAAHNAGRYVRINVGWNIGYSTYGYVIGFGKSDGQDTLIVSMPASPTMPKQVAVYMLYAGDDGKIAAQIMSAD